jgi:hypothetical protein
MPRALHRALRPVQNTQWVTVGHVVAAVAAQAQATDDDLLSNRASLHFVCNRLSIDYYRLFVLYFLLVFFFPFLSFPVLHFLYYLFRCALL